MASETLLIFGATGLTGKSVVEAALEKELKLKLFVRSPDKVAESVRNNEQVEIIKGDLKDLDAVGKACEGVTYVMCVAGDKRLSKDRFMLKMATAVVEAMPKYNVKRFYYQAGALSPKPGESLGMGIKVMRATMGRLMGIREMLMDNDAVIEMLSKSKVKWIVGMPGLIKDIPTKGTLKVGEKAGTTVSCKDLAAFDLECVLTEEHEGKGVYPCY